MFTLSFSNTLKRVYISLILLLLFSVPFSFAQTAREWALDNFVTGVWNTPPSHTTVPTNPTTINNDITTLQTIRGWNIDFLVYPSCFDFTCNDFTEAHVDYRLNIASQAGLRVLISDRRHMVYYDNQTLVPPYNNTTANDIVDHYRDELSVSHPTWRDAILGYHIKSEPDPSAGWPVGNPQRGYDLSEVKSWMGFLKTNDPDKLSFINLFPPLAWFSVFGILTPPPGGNAREFTDTEKPLFYDYLDEYLNGNPNEIPDIVCFDNYVYGDFRFNYFWPLDAVRSYAGNRPFWVLPDIRRNRSELRFTSFCPIAYGAKGLLYYYYSPYTSRVAWALEINNYAKNIIQPVLFNTNYIGTFHTDHFEDDAGNVNEHIPQSAIINLNTTPLVSAINHDRALVGIYYDQNNLNAYLFIVNKGYTDAMGNMSCTVTLRGNFQNQVYSSNYSTGTWDTIPTGTFSGFNTTFTVSNLPPGQGQLFRVEGAILDDATISGTQTFSKNLVVGAGATLNLTSGSNITFTGGKGIHVYGNLNANGPAGRITFNFTSPGSAGNQNGIFINSNGSSTITYCNILNAYKGIALRLQLQIQ